MPVTIKFPGQNADYTFNAVAGRAASFAISKPNVSDQFAIGVFDSSGAQVVGWTGFSTTPCRSQLHTDWKPNRPHYGCNHTEQRRRRHRELHLDIYRGVKPQPVARSVVVLRTNEPHSNLPAMVRVSAHR